MVSICPVALKIKSVPWSKILGKGSLEIILLWKRGLSTKHLKTTVAYNQGIIIVSNLINQSISLQKPLHPSHGHGRMRVYQGNTGHKAGKLTQD